MTGRYALHLSCSMLIHSMLLIVLSPEMIPVLWIARACLFNYCSSNFRVGGIRCS